MDDFLSTTSMTNNMQIRSLRLSAEFYNDLFSFKITQKENPNKLDVPSQIIDNDTIKLCMNEVSTTYPERGITHFEFNVENFGEIIEKCKELEVEVLYGGPVKFEKSRSVYIKDPNCYEIESSEIQGGGL